MTDYITRATAAKGQIRAFAISAQELTETARMKHNTSPIATAALGRLLSAAAIMGIMMKGEKDILTIQIKGRGPMRGITVTADAKAQVKGYVEVPDVVLPVNEKGKLDVGGAIGKGVMSVIKDMGLKEPYIGQTILQTGEIAEDLAYYFATSEQVPSAIGLGVLMNKDNTVRQAGGFLIQLMPFAEEAVIDQLEKKVATVTSVTDLLDQGANPEQLLEHLLGDFELEINEHIPVTFHCNCSHDKIKKALISIGKKDLLEMVEEEKPIEVNCHFCNTNYSFSPAELYSLLEESE